MRVRRKQLVELLYVHRLHSPCTDDVPTRHAVQVIYKAVATLWPNSARTGETQPSHVDKNRVRAVDEQPRAAIIGRSAHKGGPK